MATPKKSPRCPNCGSNNTAPTAGNGVGNTMDCLRCFTDFTPPFFSSPSAEVFLRWRWGDRIVQVEVASPFAKKWPMGTSVSVKWGHAFRRRGIVIGYTSQKVVVGMDDYPFITRTCPKLLKKTNETRD